MGQDERGTCVRVSVDNIAQNILCYNIISGVS